MNFDEINDHLRETLILTQEIELREAKWRNELYRAQVAEAEQRNRLSLAQLRESYNRLMDRQGGPQQPSA